MAVSVRSADESTVRLLDGALVFWVALWLVVGAWAGVTIWSLSDLGDTVSSSGRAIASAGQALEAFGDVPVLGERPGEVGRETSVAGADIEARGQEVKGELHQLAVLLGLAIAVMPTTPVVGLYVPLRASRRRERARIARSLRAHPDDTGLDRYLAENAIRHLSWSEVRRIDDDPWHALQVGDTRALADAEIARLGLSRARG